MGDDRAGKSDADATTVTLTGSGYPFQTLFVVGQHFAKVRTQYLTGVGQDDAALGPLYQRNAHLVLKSGNHFAQCGLRHVKHFRCTGKIEQFGKGQIAFHLKNGHLKLLVMSCLVGQLVIILTHTRCMRKRADRESF